MLRHTRKFGGQVSKGRDRCVRKGRSDSMWSLKQLRFVNLGERGDKPSRALLRCAPLANSRPDVVLVVHGPDRQTAKF